jgi:hypothetical protein
VKILGAGLHDPTVLTLHTFLLSLK